LGIEGERIDVGAHLAGFLSGCVLGFSCLAVGSSAIAHRMTGAYGLGATILFAGAWLLALFQASS
jgi:hypothetical protein